MLAVLIFFTVLMLLFTFLPLSRCAHWIVRGMDFPRLQFAIFSAGLIIAHYIFLDVHTWIFGVLTFVTGVCFVWQLVWILPYTCLWRIEVRKAKDDNPDVQLSLLTSNVLTPNRNASALIDLVNKHQPDILVTLESDQWWEDQLAVLETDMPYTVKCPLDNLYGMHVFSRLPFDEPKIRYLVEEDVPSIHASLTLASGDKIGVHFLHPAPPSPSENTESSERDAELVMVARSVAESDLPVIVTGDLNDVAWSRTTQLFRKISGLLDPRIGRGAFNTFHVDFPLLRWPLDHLFHSHHFTLRDIKRLPSIGSDHFPLLTRLTFSPKDGHSQKGIDASQAEEDLADEISEKKHVSEHDVPEPK